MAFILGTHPQNTSVENRNTAAANDPAPWGIALSGGGIRSATFSLGVLQALAENGLLRCFHYQSTISGGGYAGAFLQGLIRRWGVERALAVLASHVGNEELQKPILHLREYSNYLSPRKKLLSGDTLGMLGTYLRNVILVQIQLCALAVALSLLPLLLYPGLLALGKDHAVACLVVAGACAVIAACLLELISKRSDVPPPVLANDDCPNPLGGPPAEQPESAVLKQALAIVYLVAAGTILGALGLWGPLVPGRDAHSMQLSNLSLMLANSACYLGLWSFWLFNTSFSAQAGVSPVHSESATTKHVRLRFFVATVMASLLIGPLLAGVRELAHNWLAGSLWHTLIFGPPCVLAAVMFTGIVHVGLAGPALTDLQREMWARVSGKAAATVLGFTSTLAVVVYGPWLMTWLFGLALARWRVVGWLSALTWIFTTGTGVLAAYSQKIGGARTRSPMLDGLVRLAPGMFLLGLLVAVSLGTQQVLHAMVDARCTPDCLAADYLAGLSALAQRFPAYIAAALGVALAVWGIFGSAIDVNEFSMNAFYRNRLVRCYLGASRLSRRPEPTTNFDPDDDLTLADVVNDCRDKGNARPLYPLVGTTLNLVDTKQLDWQDRKAASFVFTPGFCGYVPPSSHPDATAIGDDGIPTANTGNAEDAAGVWSLARHIQLGSAMAISGAAVSPNMGYHSSAAVTLLLTLFDARLGWWLPNPRRRRHAKKAPQITFYGEWLVREMLGRTREEGDFVYLSDGGHFENLGIYELVRRQCEFILCIDGSADPDRSFADLGNAIQKCRTDFGCEICVDVSELRRGADGMSQRHCAIGTIEYHISGKRGVLFYIKPSLTGSETADVAYYAHVHPDFPHESTADQYFDEAQFESYRRLGRGIASAAFEKVIECAKAAQGDQFAAREPAAFGLCESDLRDFFLRELQHHWVGALKGTAEHFSKHAHVMASLFAKLRKEPSLSTLDAHIYPAWNDIAGTTSKQGPEELAALPSDADFRACFYFCQELVQLMESVYHDLDLEHAWEHPDNRGWLNAFRQWSWSPVFRIAWAAGSPTYGKPFVTFCEMRLGLPALEKRDFTCVDEYPVEPGDSWEERCKALMDARRINPLEYGVLTSRALAPAVGDDQAGRRILLLRMKWNSIVVRSPCTINDSTLGMAVIVDGSLRLMRIQDHVRRMGLAAALMRQVVERGIGLAEVAITSGDYGYAGICTPEHAAQLTRRLNALRLHAQSVCEGAL